MLTLLNTALPMHLDRLYASEGSTQAAYASQHLNVTEHTKWLDSLLNSSDEQATIDLLNPSSHSQHAQHSIDTYVINTYIHERHQPPFSTLTHLIGTPLTLSFDIPSGTAFRHLHITAIRQIDHEGSYGYYCLIAQPIISALHQHSRAHIDTDTDVVSMIAQRLSALDVEVIDDSNQHWTPARMTQWQLSDWAHICERLSRQGLTGYLRHNQTPEHTPPRLIITNAKPSETDNISQNIGAIRFHRALHDRVHAPILAINQHITPAPNNISVARFNSHTVSHPTQESTSSPVYDSSVFTAKLAIDTPAAMMPVTDTDQIDDATILAESLTAQHNQYSALSYATDANIADTFMLVDHPQLNNAYRITHMVHLAHNSLSHITGLTQSSRHLERHASRLTAGSHLTQLRLLLADTPWIGSLYKRQTLPPMTGITGDQSDTDSRNHLTPTRLALFETSAQPIAKLEAQAGSNYGTHFTHRASDQTLVQSIGDGEHLINSGSLLSTTRPSLFKADNEKAVESGYRHKSEGSLSEWVTDHRSDKAYSQLANNSNQVHTTLKMGVIHTSTDAKREGIHIATDKQVSVKTGQALVISSQPQTHTQSSEHDYQHHTPTLTQTSLGGQHLNERLTQLATGLGRNVSSHKDIKTQLEAITKEQTSTTHQQTPYTLIDSTSDSSYVSEDLLVHRAMGEMLSTTQQDRVVSSGKAHHQVSGESTTIVADGSVSLTNAKDNIMLSAHTGRLEATAKQDVNIASSTKEVEIVASNKITINAGGASITLDGGDITIRANEFVEKAGKHNPASGGFDGQGLEGLPATVLINHLYGIQFEFKDDDDIPLAYVNYIATNLRTGKKKTGVTDENGFTEKFHTDNADDIEVHLKLDSVTNEQGITDSYDNIIIEE